MKCDVFVVDDWGSPASNIASFYTVREAESYINGLHDINPSDVEAGRYAIDAPERAIRLLANRDKQLNHYQLACGYIQNEANTTTDREVQLWHESSHYHVRAHDHREHKRLGWETFSTLKEARESFKSMVRLYL